MEWDFFVSYTSADRAWAEWVAWELERDGHRVLVQVWDFVPGTNWVDSMHAAAGGAARTIAVLSNAYLRSAYGKAEWQAAWRDDPLGERRRLLVLRVEDCERPGLLGSVVSEDLFGLTEPAARQRLRQVVAGALTGRAKPTAPPGFPGATPRFPGALPDVWHVPPRNPNFTGRAEQLDALHRSTGTVSVRSVRGMGGVGKSHLVVEYAHRHASGFDVVWWIPAEQPAVVPDHFAALAAALGLDGDPVPAVHAALRRSPRWLVIFDNAEDPDALRPHLPQGPGRVLITTRRAGFDALGEVLDLDTMDRADSLALVRRRVPGVTDEEATTLADLLGDLPLAIEQASAYIRATGIPAGSYADLLRTRTTEMIAQGRVAGRDDTLASLWDLSLTALADGRPAARRLLDLLARLAPEPVPLDLLTGHPEALPGALGDVVTDPVRFTNALGALVDHYLVRRTTDTVTVAHRLLRQSLLVRSDDPVAHRTALALLHLAAPPDAEPARWARWRALLPHVLAVVEDVPAGTEAVAAELSDRAARYLVVQGRGPLAEALARRALGWVEGVHGPDSPEAITGLHGVAVTLHLQEDYEGARRVVERALAISEERLGPDHPATVTALGGLGNLLIALGRSAEARPLLERALSIVDPHRELTAERSWNLLYNLGRALFDAGEPDEAERHLRRVAAAVESARGADHPDLGYPLSGLAHVLHHRGRTAEAVELAERVVGIVERHFEPDHPRLVWYREALARMRA